MNGKLKPSRYNFRTKTLEGEMLIYNSATGEMGVVPTEFEQEVLVWLKDGVSGELPELARDLADHGFLIPEDVNEIDRTHMEYHREMYRNDLLHLIIMPTEQCNFRCVYCYESFERGTMPQEIRGGIKAFVEEKAPYLSQLTVSWFGGEPLLGREVIEDLSQFFLELQQRYGFAYTATMTTNGYRLDPKTLAKMLKFEIRNYQITLDGNAEDHDQKRVLMGGQGTFQKIYENLLKSKEIPDEFSIHIRVNVDQKNKENVPRFFEQLSNDFRHDPRYSVYCRTVGKWGGPNDSELDICTDKAKTMLGLDEIALTRYGMKIGLLGSLIEPNGFVCYAAKPYSFVIGSDGTVYKCTVALEEDFNKVGQIRPDGQLALDMNKFATWITADGSRDSGCQACYFKPACQGSACPLIRIQEDKRPCPSEKTRMGHTLRIVWATMQKELETHPRITLTRR